MQQSSTSTRSFGWEDTATSEPLFRRARQSTSPDGRTRPGALPGMPLEMADPDGEDEVRPGRNRFGGPRNPWWRPRSVAGRVLLGVSLLTVLCGLTVGTLFLKNHLSRDGRFRIAGSSNIEATGLTEVSRKQMLPIFGEDIGRNIFFVPLSERRRELEEIPWVEHATVMRVLPDQIRVSLVERQPVAFVRQGNTIGLVDANGVLLSMSAASMARHHYSFPVVTGIDPADPIASRKARMAVYLRMVAELDANSQHFSEQVSEIDLTDPEDARVLMPEQGDDILAHFGDDKFVDRFRNYKVHISEWRKQYPRLASVDLRYDQQVVLQMKNAATVEARPGVEEGSSEKAAAGEGTKPAAAKPASLETTDGKPVNAKTDGKAKPKALTAKQKAAKAEAAREIALEAKAAKMRAARARAAAAKQNTKPEAAETVADRQNDQPAAGMPTTSKQNKKPAAQTDVADKNKRSPGAQPAAMNLNGQKSVTTPHSTQTGTEGQ
jgi:cell division protein FtsQ